MPLRGLINEKDVIASFLSANEWAELRTQCCCLKDLPAFPPVWHTTYCAPGWIILGWEGLGVLGR